MLEQVSTSVKFLAFYTASKQGKTGLTVTIDIYNPSGTQIVTAGSATALGGGLYAYTLSTDNSSEGEYAAIFKTDDSTVDAQHIPSLWVLGRAGVENLDAATSSRLASSGYTAPANSDISAIKSKTDNLPSDPADQSLVESAISALSIPTVVQIRSEMDSNSTKLANLDATISSRSTLTTGDLPSVPSAASVATAVRTELTEISNLDASISSRLASADYAEPTSAPSASSVASAVRTELGTELGRIDQNISSRLAAADYTTPPTTAQISSAVEGSLLDENDGQAVLNALVGAIGNQNVDEIALVAAIRSDLERTGGKLDSIPTDAAPSAASVATAVWSASTKEITGGTVDTLTNAPESVTPADIWDYNDRTLTSASGPTAVEIRQEIDANSSKLDVAISSRLADADYVEPANSDVAAIKAKTDALPSDPADQSLLEAAIAGVTAPSAATVASAVRSELSSELSKVSALNTERLANVATTAIVGNLIAQANS
jgi:hypothetical protein